MPRFHTVEINKTEWIVPERYQMLTPVGSGAYGQVWYVILIISFIFFLFSFGLNITTKT